MMRHTTDRAERYTATFVADEATNAESDRIERWLADVRRYCVAAGRPFVRRWRGRRRRPSGATMVRLKALQRRAAIAWEVYLLAERAEG